MLCICVLYVLDNTVALLDGALLAALLLVFDDNGREDVV